MMRDMRKIPTVFRRDPERMSRVLDTPHEDCLWVLDGEGTPTRKYDGTCVMLDESGDWWARREVKRDKAPPPNFRAEETDPNTGKTVGWEPIDQSAFAKAFATVTGVDELEPGTYELCGPKVNGNPEGLDTHRLISHANAEVLTDVPRTFEALREYLADFPHEGIVWHHPDGRMAKLKVRDFR